MEPIKYNEDSLAYGTTNITIPGFSVPSVILPLYIWALFASPTMFLLLFLNRRVRNVGPLILVFMMITLGGVEMAQLLIHADIDKGFPVTHMIFKISGLNGTIIYYAILIMGFTLFGIPAWFVVRWISRCYYAKKFSDQTILFDSIWLLATLALCGYLIMEVGSMGWLGIFAFVIYKLVQIYGLRSLQLTAKKRHNSQLLFLRVFGSGKRTQHFFDLLNARWRYIGSIELVASTDLAGTTLEPNEFLDFLSGKLRNNFIRNHEELGHRLATLDLKPDADGRFRVNEFFCFDDTWQMTVISLIGQSDVVIMDLRNFSRENRGCIFELQTLVDLIPLKRVVILIDHTTDYPFLEVTLRHCWEGMRASSPNADSDVATLQLLRAERSVSATVNRLMLICDHISASTGTELPLNGALTS
ncbi:MAG: hypothetical protein KKA54_14800 [Proteobacteria bacterium]|nr:hypothetical protein [Pseudomonadota bacterium]MBU0967638.1 hypothetical protein [Pseudomonadota bacterium]